MAEFHKGPFLDMRPEGFAGLLVVIIALFSPFAIFGNQQHNGYLFWVVMGCFCAASVLWLYFSCRERRRLQKMFPAIYGDSEPTAEERRSELKTGIIKIVMTVVISVSLVVTLMIGMFAIDVDTLLIEKIATIALCGTVLLIALRSRIKHAKGE